jgi:hypothetical protein
VGLNSSGTLGPRHSKARPKGWAYNRVPTVRNTLLRRIENIKGEKLKNCQKLLIFNK